MLSIRKLMSVVKDVDLEAMPSSIFVNDDDDDDDITDVFFVVTNIDIVSISAEAMWTHL